MKSMKTTPPIERCKVVCFNRDKIQSLKQQLPPERKLHEAARCCKVLGHPARQAILRLLEREECCVCDIAAVLDKPVSTVSQHLHALLAEELLETRREGKLVFYCLSQIRFRTNKPWNTIVECA
jgi:predicted transcriptional regulator